MPEFILPAIVKAIVEHAKFNNAIHIAEIDKTLETKYDLIYIENITDGLTLDKVIGYALKALESWGVLVVAQTLPKRPSYALPGGPCGDAWASIMQMRMLRGDLMFKTLEQDYGYTVIYRKPSDVLSQYPLTLSTWNTKRNQIMQISTLQEILDALTIAAGKIIVAIATAPKKKEEDEPVTKKKKRRRSTEKTNE